MTTQTTATSAAPAPRVTYAHAFLVVGLIGFAIYTAGSVVDALVTTHVNQLQALQVPFRAIILLLAWIVIALERLLWHARRAARGVSNG